MIAVTGAAGAVGRRVVRQLAAGGPIDGERLRILAVDRDDLPTRLAALEAVEPVRLDLLAAGPEQLGQRLDGADIVVHLAEVDGRRDDAGTGLALLDRLLRGLEMSGFTSRPRRLVVSSSALVYGAWDDNPVPVFESRPPRPNDGMAFAEAKLRLEQRATAWAEGHGWSAALVRPTTTLSERDTSWVSAALRAGVAVRPEQLDPPVQFLHHDDLASAYVTVIRKGLEGPINVAPDGWVGSEVFRQLVGGLPVRLPSTVSRRLRSAGGRVGIRQAPHGIEPYVSAPWVVSNAKLRAAGWVPAFSNEEAFVAGTPAPPWAMSAQRRQELALAAAGAALAAAGAVAGGAARKLSR